LLLSSQTLRTSPRLRHFLAHIVRHSWLVERRLRGRGGGKTCGRARRQHSVATASFDEAESADRLDRQL